jgi:hypothetical protein
LAGAGGSQKGHGALWFPVSGIVTAMLLGHLMPISWSVSLVVLARTITALWHGLEIMLIVSCVQAARRHPLCSYRVGVGLAGRNSLVVSPQPGNDEVRRVVGLNHLFEQRRRVSSIESAVFQCVAWRIIWNEP